MLFAVIGKDPEVGNDLNTSRLDVYLSHTPAGTSVKNMAHWAQMVRKKQFCMFDFGKQENLKRYGQEKAPVYHLDQIRVPIALFSGGEDILADPLDVNRLESELNKNYIIHHEFIEE